MACPLRKESLVSQPSRKSKKMNTETFESTYALLLRSDEKERSVSETVVYLLLILTMAFTVWQAAQTRVTVPTNLRAPAVAQALVPQQRSV